MKKKSGLEWWEWVEMAGGIALMSLLILLLSGISVPAVVAGLVLHLACDFLLQSEETSDKKRERGRHLAVHALIAGGLPGIVTGLMVAAAPGAVIGFSVGVVSHYAIDWSRKFGISDVAIGVILDQAAHVAVLLILVTCLS